MIHLRLIFFISNANLSFSYSGLLPPSLLVENLLSNTRMSNGSVNGGPLQATNFDLSMFTGNLVSETAISAIAASNEARFVEDRKPSPSQQTHPAPPPISDLLTQPAPFLFNSLDNTIGANLNSNFYTILEAIRQLEESASNLTGSTATSMVNQQQQQQPPPPQQQQQQQQQANVLVR